MLADSPVVEATDTGKLGITCASMRLLRNTGQLLELKQIMPKSLRLTLTHSEPLRECLRPTHRDREQSCFTFVVVVVACLVVIFSPSIARLVPVNCWWAR